MRGEGIRGSQIIRVLEFFPSFQVFFGTNVNTICPKTVTLQHLIFGQLMLGAVT